MGDVDNRYFFRISLHNLTDDWFTLTLLLILSIFIYILKKSLLKNKSNKIHVVIFINNLNWCFFLRIIKLASFIEYYLLFTYRF